jgi:FkbM family methyltransferase
MSSSAITFQNAAAALNRGDNLDAEKLFKAVLQREPNHVAALNLLTVVLVRLQRYADAEEFVARAVTLDQRSDAAYYNYGIILKRVGKPEQALLQFDSALRLNPNSPETWNNRGTLLNDLKRYEDAISDFDRAISLNKNYPGALFNKGKSLSALERHEEALHAYDAALALAPDLQVAWFARGRCCIALERDSEALSSYTRLFGSQRDYFKKSVLESNIGVPAEVPDAFDENSERASDIDEIRRTLNLLEPSRAIGFDKFRVGNAADGGYVQLDDFGCLSHAFSLGVSVDDSWDIMLALKGIPVDQYDGSIYETPTQHRLLRFFKKNVAPVTTVDCIGFDDIVAPYVTADGPDFILKMDIEGAEWDILDRCDHKTLSRFAQIVVEFHNLFELRNKTFRERAQRVFAKLNNLFAVIHVHANNFGSVSRIGGKTMADTLELSYASRRRYRLEKSDEEFPTPLDGPNNPYSSDIRLGTFRF